MCVGGGGAKLGSVGVGMGRKVKWDGPGTERAGCGGRVARGMNWGTEDWLALRSFHRIRPSFTNEGHLPPPVDFFVQSQKTCQTDQGDKTPNLQRDAQVLAEEAQSHMQILQLPNSPNVVATTGLRRFFCKA
jgi:hypothetical protein